MCHQFQKSGSGKAALSRLADLAAAETLVMSMLSFHRKRIQEQIHFFDLFSDVEACNAPLVFVDLDTPPQTLSYALVDVSAACCVMADRVLIFGEIGPLHRVFSKN